MSNESLSAAFDLVSGNAAGITGIVALAFVGWRLARRFRPTRSQRRHKWNQERSYRDLAKIREINPVENPGQCFSWLRKVDPYRFEEMILSELDRRKLKIVRNTSYSGDGGIDGQFYLNGELWLIQAKRYSGFVRADHVWAFEAICAARSARGLFVHTGRTPQQFQQMKRRVGCVRVISGDELMRFFAGRTVSLTLDDPLGTTPIAIGRPERAAAPAAARNATPIGWQNKGPIPTDGRAYLSQEPRN